MNTHELIACTITELALSVDNVAVWVLIMRRFDIDERQKRAVIGAGVLIAVVARFAAIAVGEAALHRFSWLLPVLGGVLLWQAFRIIGAHDDEDQDTGPVARLVASLPPVVAATVALGLTDVMFAVDSIPASFGITRDGDIIIVANVIALAALWLGYDMVERLMNRLPYVTYGVAAVLALVGIELLTEHWVTIPEIVSVAAIVVTLSTSVIAGLIRERVATT